MSEATAPPRKLALIAAFAALYLIWGSTYLGIRLAIESIPPLLMAGTRFFLAGIIMYVIAVGRARRNLPSRNGGRRLSSGPACSFSATAA